MALGISSPFMLEEALACPGIVLQATSTQPRSLWAFKYRNPGGWRGCNASPLHVCSWMTTLACSSQVGLRRCPHMSLSHLFPWSSTVARQVVQGQKMIQPVLCSELERPLVLLSLEIETACIKIGQWEFCMCLQEGWEQDPIWHLVLKKFCND